MARWRRRCRGSTRRERPDHREEIERCQADPEARLKLSPQAIPPQLVRHKGPRYTPIAKRQDKPDAIMYLLRNHPELSDAQISKLIGTTKPTIAAVRDRTHWNSANIKPRHPVGLGLCTLQELDDAVARALRGKRPAGDEGGRRQEEAAGGAIPPASPIGERAGRERSGGREGLDAARPLTRSPLTGHGKPRPMRERSYFFSGYPARASASSISPRIAGSSIVAGMR